MSCPWAKIDKLKPVKLEEIISEEVAKKVQAKEEEKRQIKFNEKMFTASVNDTPPKEATYDSGIECNEDHDHLKSAEEKCSGSYVSNCSRLSTNSDFESDSEEEEIIDIVDEKDWDTFDSLSTKYACVSQSVFKKYKKMETAEYATVRGGKNRCKLSNKVFNSLESSSYNEEFRKYKVHRDKTKRTSANILSIDQQAWRIIHEMIKDKVLHKVLGIFNFDEDVVTLYGIHYWPSYGKFTTSMPPMGCFINVFKFNSKLGEGRAAARQKAEREAAIYERSKELNVIAQKEHVLVTSSPYVTNIKLIYPSTYEGVINSLKRFYEANLIRADLSGPKILFYSWNRLYIFDWLTSWLHNSKHDTKPDARFLFLICSDIVMCVRKYGVYNNDDIDKLFKRITGYSYLEKLQKSKKKKK